MNRAAATTLAATLLLGGCATPRSIYTWGSYEELIYASYANAGSMPPERQVEALEQDFQKARAANLRVPPGWHAHLGYLYSELGKLDQARQELQTEKAEFPESALFTDRLLANLAKP
jgi:hypothetical protein